MKCKCCGVDFIGKTCRKIYCSNKCNKKMEYERNKERYLKYGKLRYEQDKEKILKRQREYQQEHKEERSKKNKEWRENHKERTKEYDKRDYEKHRIERLTYSRLWDKFFSEKRKAIGRTRTHKRKGIVCERCGYGENLIFHHTNYEKDEGITLCRRCHWVAHNEIKEEIKSDLEVPESPVF